MVEFRCIYGQGVCTEVDIPIALCSTALSGFPRLVSAAGYSRQCQSMYFDSGEVSLMSEYKSSVRRIECVNEGIKSVFFVQPRWLNQET